MLETLALCFEIKHGVRLRFLRGYHEVEMESPPSFSGHSEAPLLSEDSGLIITSGSISSDSVSGWLHIASELQESDYDDKSLSLSDFQDMSERMCGDNFNTVKKGPTKLNVPAIEPPLQFQDSPIIGRVTAFMKDDDKRHKRGETRLCSSHSSLATQAQADDSSFITQAISHDTLSASDIADVYNVPFDSDIYAIPFDVIKPLDNNSSTSNKTNHSYRRTIRNSKPVTQLIQRYSSTNKTKGCTSHATTNNTTSDVQIKRHSVPSTSMSKKCISAVSISHDSEPMHMTLPEVQKYLQKLYSSSSESDTISRTIKRNSKSKSGVSNINNNNFKYNSLEGNLDGVSKQDISNSDSSNNNNNNNNNIRKSISSKKNNFVLNNIKPKKCNREKNNKINNSVGTNNSTDESKEELTKRSRSKKSPVKGLSLNLKQTLCNLFGLRRNDNSRNRFKGAPPPPVNRALPPLPQTSPITKFEETPMDFATSLQKVKDYGWYWGPISVEAAEKILSDEPDGSFIVRDSSDDHYIFTLTFKLNGMRHVRIEHDQGSFCFGSCQMFKAHTIVEFIENAVETSRSGRYLFFLNLRPVLGPMRVKLLYPVSRFKRVQSLQHMCRFVILKVVRRDLLNSLPLPRRLLDYLCAPHYYAEMLNDV